MSGSNESKSKCKFGCAACWWHAHRGHDVASRHADGSLASATCYDCDETYERPS